MKNRNLWRWLLAAAALILIAGIAYLFVTFGRQVNLAGINASGDEVQVQLPPGFRPRYLPAI